MLRWIVELGRIDVMTEVSMLSSHLANPRQRHLDEAIRVFRYLKQNYTRMLVFDPTYPHIDESGFVEHDWYHFYRDAKEPIPNNLPKPRGGLVTTHCFVDASHANNHANRCSQTGILIFLNRSPVIWYSKRQNTVESSTFGSEMIALKTAIEMIQGLRFKLRSFGVPIEGPTDVFCDNEAVTNAARKPEVTLSKKHNSVAWHIVQQAAAMKMCCMTWEHTSTNLADLLTKTKTRAEREVIIDRFMY